MQGVAGSGQSQAGEVAAYFDRHQIAPLFEKLCASLVFHHPADPKQFLIEQLEKLRERGGGLRNVDFYSDDDLSAVFGLMDPLQRGQIADDDVRNALTMLGVPMSRLPQIESIQAMNRVRFVSFAREQLDQLGK